MISVIIPCHNRLELLSQLLSSIPQRDDIEVILVDDYSTEDLTKIDLSVFPYYQYIRNDTPDRYAGSARNIGIENSSGEYLFFADSDDRIVTDGFVGCLEVLERERPDILYAKSTSFFDHDNRIANRHIRNNWLVDEVARGADKSILARLTGPIAKFIRRDFIEQHSLLFDNRRVANDIVFAALLVVNQPVIKVCDEVVYAIRQGNPALTSDYSIESTETRLRALLDYNKVLADNGLRHLMAPALPLLGRLVRNNPVKFIYWSVIFLTERNPVFFTWWTLQNMWRRRRSVL